MASEQDTPEAQALKQLQQRGAAATVAKTEGEAAQKQADAQLKGAKTQETMVKAHVLANTPPDEPEAPEDKSLEIAQAAHQADLAEREFDHKRQMDYMDHAQAQRQHDDEMELQAQQAQAEQADRRLQASRDAATAAQKPQAKQPAVGLR
jgi:hypothetical protein